MKPWIRLYRGRCVEVRFGVRGWQAGMTLPHVSFALWNPDLTQVSGFRWGRWLA